VDRRANTLAASALLEAIGGGKVPGSERALPSRVLAPRNSGSWIFDLRGRCRKRISCRGARGAGPSIPPQGSFGSLLEHLPLKRNHSNVQKFPKINGVARAK
jgi:hypothetical protein